MQAVGAFKGWTPLSPTPPLLYHHRRRHQQNSVKKKKKRKERCATGLAKRASLPTSHLFSPLSLHWLMQPRGQWGIHPPTPCRPVINAVSPSVARTASQRWNSFGQPLKCAKSCNFPSEGSRLAVAATASGLAWTLTVEICSQQRFWHREIIWSFF